MNAIFFGYHAITHIEAVKENRSSSKGELRDLEENSSLRNKVHPFGAAGDLFRSRKPIID